MRITENVMVNNMMNNLQHNMKKLDEYSQQLSSGRQFQHPSEAPIRAARSMDFTSLINKSEQYEDNVNQARSWLETSESAMDDAHEVMQRARELTLQGANDTMTESERENIAREMEQLREELLSIAETQHGDRYVFSGQSTGEKPFDEEGNYQGDHKNIVREINPGVDMAINVDGEEAFGKSIDALDDVIADLRGGSARIYTDELNPGPIGQNIDDWDDPEVMEIHVDEDHPEDSAEISVEIDPDDTRTEIVDSINNALSQELDADKYARLRDNQIEIRSPRTDEDSSLRIEFGDNNENLEEALFGEGEFYEPGDTEIRGEGSLRLGQEDIENFDVATRGSLQTRAQLGAKINRLDLTERRLEDEIINLRQLRSENEDTDMAETIMEMRMEESVYQASLATGARVIQPSLVDFLQ